MAERWTSDNLLIDTPELAGDTIAMLASKRPVWLAARYLSANWDFPEVLAREKEIVEGDLLKFRCKFE